MQYLSQDAGEICSEKQETHFGFVELEKAFDRNDQMGNAQAPC